MDPKPEPKPKLFTAILRCNICLDVLTVTAHIEKKPGVKVNYRPCEAHPTKGVIVEWEPE